MISSKSDKLLKMTIIRTINPPGPWPSSGIGSLQIFLETLWMTEKLSLIFCSLSSCLRVMETTGLVTSWWNSPDGWTTRLRVGQLTPAAQTCRKGEVRGGRFGPHISDIIPAPLRRSVKDLIRKYDLELTASTFLILDSDPTSLEIACEWQRCMGGQVKQPPSYLPVFQS